jgi:hypothetical protein
MTSTQIASRNHEHWLANNWANVFARNIEMVTAAIARGWKPTRTAA